MDWTKAKTILIFALIATNLLLASALLTDPTRREATEVSEAFLQQTLAFLEDNGVLLETPLPRHIPSMGVITVNYRFFDDATVTRLLGEDWRQTTQNTYESSKGIVTIESGKILTWRPAAPLIPPKDLGEEALEAASMKLLVEHGLAPAGLSLDQIYLGIAPEFDDLPLYKLVFAQQHEGLFVGESYVHVFMNVNGVVAVEALLLDEIITAEAGGPRVMISAPEALMRKLDDILRTRIAGEPVVISRVEAGFYFALSLDAMNQLEAVASGTAVPAWKIVLRDGTTFYQEAF